MKKNLIVGQFNDSYPPIMDGVANVTKNYAFWLNKNYIKTYVITPKYPDSPESQDNHTDILSYTSIPLPKRKPYRLGIPHIDFSFQKKISKIPFDIVHAHCPFSSGKIALKIAKNLNIPSIATFHSKFYDDFKNIFKSEFLTKLMIKRIINFFNSCDFVWAVNKSTAETLKEYGFKKNIDVVYNGTDFYPPENIESAIDSVNKKLGLNKNDPILLFVGQHIWQKNLKTIILALEILKKNKIDFKMIFIGTGDAEKKLNKMVIDKKLEKNIFFLGIIHDREYLKSIFSRANLFVFPSLYDNAPIVIREASAVYCPSVVIENSNSSEGIIDNFNGFVSKNSPVDLANKIKSVITDKEKLKEIGMIAHKTIYKPWQEIIEEVKARYIEIINWHRNKIF